MGFTKILGKSVWSIDDCYRHVIVHWGPGNWEKLGNPGKLGKCWSLLFIINKCLFTREEDQRIRAVVFCQALLVSLSCVWYDSSSSLGRSCVDTSANVKNYKLNFNSNVVPFWKANRWTKQKPVYHQGCLSWRDICVRRTRVLVREQHIFVWIDKAERGSYLGGWMSLKSFKLWGYI